MSQFINASISKNLGSGALPVADQTLHSAKPGIPSDANRPLAGLKAAPDTWRCLCMNVFEASREYLSFSGMPVIPNVPEWCFSFLVWMELDSFVHFLSTAAALIILEPSFSFCKVRERTTHNFAVFPCYLSVVRQSCFSWKPHWTLVTTYYAALEAQVVLPSLSEFTHLWATIMIEMHTSSLWCHKKRRRAHPETTCQAISGARHSRGMWHVERGRGKAQASQCMRKLIRRREEADAVYLGFLQNYNRQASRLLNYVALQMAGDEPGYFVPPGGRGLWLVAAMLCQSGLACEPCGGLSKGTLMAFKELQAMTGWVIFILWDLVRGQKQHAGGLLSLKQDIGLVMAVRGPAEWHKC